MSKAWNAFGAICLLVGVLMAVSGCGQMPTEVQTKLCAERWARSGMRSVYVKSSVPTFKVAGLCMVEFQPGYWAPESAIRR